MEYSTQDDLLPPSSSTKALRASIGARFEKKENEQVRLIGNLYFCFGYFLYESMTVEVLKEAMEYWTWV